MISLSSRTASGWNVSGSSGGHHGSAVLATGQRDLVVSAMEVTAGIPNRHLYGDPFGGDQMLLDSGVNRMRARSPSPFGDPNEDARVRDPTPERPFKTSSAKLPAHFNMAIFAKKIPGMDWGEVIAKRNQLLELIAAGYSESHLRALEKFIAMLEREKLEPERRERESRGIGLSFNGSGVWGNNIVDGWTEPKSMTTKEIYDQLSSPGCRQPYAEKYSTKKTKGMRWNRQLGAWTAPQFLPKNHPLAIKPMPAQRRHRRFSEDELEVFSVHAYTPDPVPTPATLADFVQQARKKKTKKDLHPLKSSTTKLIESSDEATEATTGVLKEALPEKTTMSFATVLTKPIRPTTKFATASSMPAGSNNNTPLLRTLFDCISFTGPKMQREQLRCLVDRESMTTRQEVASEVNAKAKKNRIHKKVYWNSSFRKAPFEGGKNNKVKAMNRPRKAIEVTTATSDKEETVADSSSPSRHYDVLPELCIEAKSTGPIRPNDYFKHRRQQRAKNMSKRKVTWTPYKEEDESGEFKPTKGTIRRILKIMAKLVPDMMDQEVYRQLLSLLADRQNPTKGEISRLLMIVAKLDIFTHPIKGRTWQVDCERGDQFVQHMDEGDKVASRRLLSLIKDMYEDNCNTDLDLTAPQIPTLQIPSLWSLPCTPTGGGKGTDSRKRSNVKSSSSTSDDDPCTPAKLKSPSTSSVFSFDSSTSTTPRRSSCIVCRKKIKITEELDVVWKVALCGCPYHLRHRDNITDKGFKCKTHGFQPFAQDNPKEEASVPNTGEVAQLSEESMESAELKSPTSSIAHLSLESPLASSFEFVSPSQCATPTRNSCVICRNKIKDTEDSNVALCGCPFHTRHTDHIKEDGFECKTHGLQPFVAMQDPPQICDTYNPVNGEGDYTGPENQEHLNELGIERRLSQSTQVSTCSRSSTGSFQKSDKCVFCQKEIDPMAGHGEFDCGHKCHWEKPLADRMNDSTKIRCPKDRCKLVSTFCQSCKPRARLGLGPYETGCYCNTDNTKKDNRHADELEEELRKASGKCPDCTERHPGFCLLCAKLFTLPITGEHPRKVYLSCCQAYYHRDCWYSEERTRCPIDGTPMANVELIDVDYTPVCGLPVAQNVRQLPRPRGRMGGRPLKTDRLASSRASMDSILMPPPALPPRRSLRLASIAASPSPKPVTPTRRTTFDPVTNMCASNHSKHFGYGCAAFSANHLPDYYSSTAKPTGNCPHCDALLLNAEMAGPSKFSKCCAKGKLKLRQRYDLLQRQTPEMEALFTLKNNNYVRWSVDLIKRSMMYNEFLSFGHMRVERKTDFRDSYRIVKINGMINYILWDYNPPGEGMPLLHGQIFTLPPEAAEERYAEIGREHKLDIDVLLYVYARLRKYHPLAKLYMTAAATFNSLNPEDRLKMRLLLVDTNGRGAVRILPENEERIPIDVAGHLPPASEPDAAALLVQNDIHPGRIVYPTELGRKLLAQIYLDSGENVPPCYRYDVILKGRQGTGVAEMKWYNRYIDCALFPLLFICAQETFAPGIACDGRITIADEMAAARDGIYFAAAKSPVPDPDPEMDVDQGTDVVDSDEEEQEPEDERNMIMDDDDKNSVYDDINFWGEESVDQASEAEEENEAKKRLNCSMAEFFRYMAHIRGSNWKAWHWLWNWGMLAQQYTLTYNNRREAQIVQYEKRRQGKFNICRPSALLDMLKKWRDGLGMKGDIGRAYFTNANIRGSRQFYQKKYGDIMAMFRAKGNPDLMITFTMDPESPELDELASSNANNERQQWYDRPDIVCRLFIDKYNEFLDDLFEKEVMGPVACGVSVIEHQGRGLPHIHVLLSLDWDRMRIMGRTMTREEYMREYIWAEIPDEVKGRTKADVKLKELRRIVTTQMIHTCCQSRCLVDGKCNKHFPKQFSEDYTYAENHYPQYRRRPPAPNEEERLKNPHKYGNTIVYQNTATGKPEEKTNEYVVAYNPYLLLKYKAHINVEYIAGPGCAKYLTKYLMKGADMAFVQLREDGFAPGSLRYDEFHQMRLVRYATSMEAFLALWNIPLVRMTHEVDELDVHGPEGHQIAVEHGQELQAAEDLEKRKATGEERRTQLNSYFEYNALNPGLGLTYETCYKKLCYDRRNKRWKPRKHKANKKVCRLKSVSPSNNELMALRILLLHVEDPKSWKDLRTYEGRTYNTFGEAARARNLLTDNTLWLRVAVEHLSTKRTLRQRLRWIAVFLASNQLLNPSEILEAILTKDNNHWLVNSKVANSSIDVQRQYVLRSLEWFLREAGVKPDDVRREDGTMQTACEFIGLPRPENCELNAAEYVQLEFFPDDFLNARLKKIDEALLDAEDKEAMYKHYAKIYEERKVTANKQQEDLIEAIYGAVIATKRLIDGIDEPSEQRVPRTIMVEGEGGSGKTWSLITAIAKIRASGLNFHALATTGSAADLLPVGDTVHKRLCRALHVDSTTPLPDRGGTFAELLRQIHGILIDEVSMLHKDVLEYVDRLFRYVAPEELKHLPFGGKTVVLSVDWKQLPPVVQGQNAAASVTASVKQSELYQHFKGHVKKLHTNVRLEEGQEPYRQFLLKIGTGCSSIMDAEDRVQLPRPMCVNNREELLNFVFPKEVLEEPFKHSEELAGSAILTPLNDYALDINNQIMDRIKGAEKIYTGVTEAIADKSGQDQLEHNIADADYENLKRMSPPGIPQHDLRVVVGSVMMLTRNLSVRGGLCNGTRVQIMELGTNLIKAKIMTGSAKGKEYDLHPMKFEFGANPHAPNEGTIKTLRIQFPLRPGSAMTINKSQGQTLTRVGLLCDRSEPFAHGQLYTALSRVRNANDIRACVTRPDGKIRNIVMSELLNDDDIIQARTKECPTDKELYPKHPVSDQPVSDQPESTSTPVNREPTSAAPTTPDYFARTSRLQLNAAVTRDHLDKLNVVHGDITEQDVEMIVNAANRQLIMGGGVDRAIHLACRPEMDKLQEACAHITKGHDLPDGWVECTETYGRLRNKFPNGNVKYIAHAVGPCILGTSPKPEERMALQRCYQDALNKLIEKRCHTIAFPCISVGAFHYPRDAAAIAAVEALLHWLSTKTQFTDEVHEIRLVVFDKEQAKLYNALLERTRRQIVSSRQSSRSRSSSQKRDAFVQPALAQAPATCSANLPLQTTPKTSKQKATKTIAPIPKASTSAQIPSERPAQQPQAPPRYTKVDIVDNDGHGNCFFYSINLVLLGSDSNLAHSNMLRNAMARLLRAIVDNPDLYPRAGGFQDRASFLDYLRHNFAGAAEGRTTAQRLRAHADDLQTNMQWASIYDARLAALVTGRTVVMLRTVYDTVIAAQVKPQWDDDHPQQYDIYFPNGDSFCESRSPDFSLDNIHDFMVSRMTGAYDETGRWDRERGELITRNIVNPIVVWYNGYNHFQTIIHRSAPPPTPQEIQQAIERLGAQEVPEALTQQPAPDFVPMHQDVEVPGANPNVVIDL